jgi:hypothetical protein
MVRRRNINRSAVPTGGRRLALLGDSGLLGDQLREAGPQPGGVPTTDPPAATGPVSVRTARETVLPGLGQPVLLLVVDLGAKGVQ